MSATTITGATAHDGTAEVRSRLVLWCAVLLGATLLAPLVVAPTVAPFQTARTVFVRALVEAALALAVVAGVLRTRARLPALEWAVVGWLLATFAATALSLNPYRSVWGDLQRGEGTVTVAHNVVVFLLATRVLTSWRRWMMCFRVGVGVLLPVAVLALVQAARGVAATTTLGNTAVAGACFLFGLGFCGIVALRDERRAWRTLAVITGCILVAAVVVTGVRAVQLALLGAGGLVGACVLLGRLPGRRVVARVLLVALPVVVLAAFALDALGFGHWLPTAYQRMVQVSAVADASLTPRLMALEVSWRAWLEHPVFGFGPEMFRVAYNRHFDPAHLTFNQHWFDRPHNKLAEVAVTTGVVGLVAFLVMLAVAFLQGLRFVRGGAHPRDRLVMSCALGTLAAYLLQALALFDTPVTSLMMFLTLAFVAYLGGTPAPDDGMEPTQRPATVVVTTVMFLVLFFLCCLRPLYTAWQGELAREARGPAELAVRLDNVVEGNGYALLEVLAENARVLLERGRAEDPAWGPVSLRLAEDLEVALGPEPLDPRNHLLLGRLYHRLASREPHMRAVAAMMFQRAGELAPSRPDAMWELGGLAMSEGQWERARELFRRGLRLNPANPRAAWNQGRVLILSGHPDVGVGLMEAGQAWGLALLHAGEADVLAQAYRARGDVEKVAALDAWVREQFPSGAGHSAGSVGAH
ncbi:MAG: O-antigen ligase family protein [Myxococcota bacterium]